MLTYSFADLQGESMYAHLYKCIKNDITNGVLHAEEKLPSKRMLAKNLGISLITVENAYAQLVVEGYIYSQPKRGYYVARIEQQPLPVKAERKAAPSLKHKQRSKASASLKAAYRRTPFPITSGRAFCATRSPQQTSTPSSATPAPAAFYRCVRHSPDIFTSSAA